MGQLLLQFQDWNGAVEHHAHALRIRRHVRGSFSVLFVGVMLVLCVVVALSVHFIVVLAVRLICYQGCSCDCCAEYSFNGDQP